MDPIRQPVFHRSGDLTGESKGGQGNDARVEIPCAIIKLNFSMG